MFHTYIQHRKVKDSQETSLSWAVNLMLNKTKKKQLRSHKVVFIFDISTFIIYKFMSPKPILIVKSKAKYQIFHSRNTENIQRTWAIRSGLKMLSWHAKRFARFSHQRNIPSFHSSHSLAFRNVSSSSFSIFSSFTISSFSSCSFSASGFNVKSCKFCPFTLKCNEIC